VDGDGPPGGGGGAGGSGREVLPLLNGKLAVCTAVAT